GRVEARDPRSGGDEGGVAHHAAPAVEDGTGANRDGGRLANREAGRGAGDREQQTETRHVRASERGRQYGALPQGRQQIHRRRQDQRCRVHPGHRLLHADGPDDVQHPFPAMVTANTYAAGRIPAAPRAAAGVRLANPSTAATSPVSQTRNENMGSGRKGNRARMARTAGLYTERKSVSASSATWIANAAHSTAQARPKPLTSRLLPRSRR